MLQPWQRYLLRQPERGASLVLVSLILVAAVANLNLRGRERRACPSIGAGVRLLADDAQPDRGRLLARSRRVGALPRRARRPLRAQADAAPRHGARDPASCLAAWAPSDDVLFVARLLGGARGRHGLPDHARADHRAVVGPGRTKSIALWSGLGGAISALGPLLSGLLLEHFWWGSVFLLTLPLAVGGARAGLPLRPEPRQRDDRSGRQPRRHPLGRAGRRR